MSIYIKITQRICFSILILLLIITSTEAMDTSPLNTIAHERSRIISEKWSMLFWGTEIQKHQVDPVIRAPYNDTNWTKENIARTLVNKNTLLNSNHSFYNTAVTKTNNVIREALSQKKATETVTLSGNYSSNNNFEFKAGVIQYSLSGGSSWGLLPYVAFRNIGVNPTKVKNSP